jgi:PAS domain S-box-containing protein
MADRAGTVLVVDDEPAGLYATSRTLERAGFDVVEAASGTEALALAPGRELDLILLDVNLGDTTGFAVARALKAAEPTSLVPILLLSATYVGTDFQVLGLEEGADGYLTQPIDAGVLVATVRAFIRARKAELAVREAGRQWRDSVDAVADAIVLLDSGGTIVRCNRAFSELAGLPYQALIGEHYGVVAAGLEIGELLDVAGKTGTTATEDRAVRGRWFRVTVDRTNGRTRAFSVAIFHDVDGLHRAERERAAAAARLGALQQVTAGLARARTRRDVAESLIAAGLDAVRADAGAVHLLDAAAEHLELAGARGWPDDLTAQWHRFPVEAELPGAEAVRFGRPVYLETLEAVGSGPALKATRDDTGSASWALVPLVATGAPLGLLGLSFVEPRRFSVEERELIETMASQAAQALERAALYEEAVVNAQAARILTHVSDGVVLIDEDGLVAAVNPAAETIIGVSGAGVVGRPISTALHGWDGIAGEIPVVEDPTRVQRAKAFPFVLDGIERWLSVSGVTFDEGTVYRIADVTESRQLEAVRDDFVTTVSHELRTPLTAIYGAAKTLARSEEPIDPGVRTQIVEMLVEQCERLTRRVTEILTTSEIDAGSLRLDTGEIDLRHAVDDAVERTRATLPEDHSLDVRVPTRPCLVAGDGDRLRQVLANLLDNAVKYSPSGGRITVHVRRAVRGQVRLTVTDDGVGIPEQDRERVFEKFVRLDPNMHGGVGGTGLGLYICRTLVERMGGRIWVESKGSSGATFVVTLPEAGRRAEQRLERDPRATASAR